MIFTAGLTINARSKREAMRIQLDTARAESHQVLGSLSPQELRRQSLNPGWTNGEILARMVFGFIITDVTVPLHFHQTQIAHGARSWREPG